jgi:preprotein translocase subunit SecA
LGLETLREVERQVMLRIIDQRWREHLYEMDHLRDGIHLRAMAQKDPTTEWQREGFELFQQLTELLQRDLVRYIMRVQLSSSENEDRKPEEVTTSGPEGPVTGAAAVAMAAGAPTEVKESRNVITEQKIKDEKESTPRNSPCHCGSGRKFKHCHGR